MGTIALFQQRDLDRPWVLSVDRTYSSRAVLGAVAALAEALPDRRHCILMCDNRLTFLVGYLAALARNQHVLLPPSRATSVIDGLSAEWSDSYCLVDQADPWLAGEQFECVPDFDSGASSARAPVLSSANKAITLFTSGSTGFPKPNVKSWIDMIASADRFQSRFGIGESDALVATVPPQHMFGFETSIMLPIHSGAQIRLETPLYPEDIRLNLERSHAPVTLITTPIHLRAFGAADDWPQVRQVISATAPLSSDLAAENEARLRAPVYDILGSTELGAFASRQPARSSAWTMLAPLELHVEEGKPVVRDDSRELSMTIGDRIRVIDGVSFEFLGRPDDLVKVGGKRASLADLNLKLTGIDGVEDGVFVLREQGRHISPRLSALVVAPDLSDAQINEALSLQIDPVFLPRPLYRVQRIPRNATGKISRDALQNLLAKLADA